MFDFNLNDFLYRLIYVIPAIIPALVFHEFSHAYSAHLFGDDTAKNAGRLTLNPLKHLDVAGTLLLIFTFFGWAKPVPVNPFFFGPNRKRKFALVSLAGPVANLLMAIIAVLLLDLGMFYFSLSDANYLYYFLAYLFQINVSLAIFNLLPVPPLDGSNILYGIMPDSWSEAYFFLQKYGFIILIFLVFFFKPFSNFLGSIIQHVCVAISTLVGMLF